MIGPAIVSYTHWFIEGASTLNLNFTHALLATTQIGNINLPLFSATFGIGLWTTYALFRHITQIVITPASRVDNPSQKTYIIVLL